MHMQKYSWKNQILTIWNPSNSMGFGHLLHLSEQVLWEILNLPN